MTATTIRFNSEAERKTYESGLALVTARIDAARKVKPTAEQIAEHHLHVGKAIVAKRLASATTAKTLAPTAKASSTKPIDWHQFRTAVFQAAKSAAQEAAKIIHAKPSQAPTSTKRYSYYANGGRVKCLSCSGGLFGSR